jgi:hypothetical protein
MHAAGCDPAAAGAPVCCACERQLQRRVSTDRGHAYQQQRGRTRFAGSAACDGGTAAVTCCVNTVNGWATSTASGRHSRASRTVWDVNTACSGLGGATAGIPAGATPNISRRCSWLRVTALWQPSDGQAHGLGTAIQFALGVRGRYGHAAVRCVGAVPVAPLRAEVPAVSRVSDCCISLFTSFSEECPRCVTGCVECTSTLRDAARDGPTVHCTSDGCEQSHAILLYRPHCRVDTLAVSPAALVGRELRLLWPEDDAWFLGTATAFIAASGRHRVGPSPPCRTPHCVDLPASGNSRYHNPKRCVWTMTKVVLVGAVGRWCMRMASSLRSCCAQSGCVCACSPVRCCPCRLQRRLVRRPSP